MKIAYDKNIPDVPRLFAAFGEVIPFADNQELDKLLSSIDVLLVRTVTPVTEELLHGSKVRFVGSMTIGSDHVDLEYLEREGIAFASAPGCNAEGVADYVIAALSRFFSLEQMPGDASLGIVGYGNIGRALHRRLSGVFADIKVVDPFLDPGDFPEARFCSLGQVLQSRVISFHVPLTKAGSHPTFHMVDGEILAKVREDAVLVNTSRGAVVDNVALRQHLQHFPALRAVLDVWENEPDVDEKLVGACAISTPHIAGYTENGKRNASAMVYRAFCHWQGLEPDDVPAGGQAFEIEAGEVREVIRSAFDIESLGREMKEIILSGEQSEAVADAFAGFRNRYQFRREFGDCCVRGADSIDASSQAILEQFGFRP